MLSLSELALENEKLRLDSSKKDQQIETKDQQIQTKDQRIKVLEEYIRLHNAKQFGASSEKDDGSQGQLFNEAEQEIVEADKPEEISVPAHTRKKKKRASIPEGLPVEEIIYDLAESEKVCPHDGAELKTIGEEVHRQLDIEPAKIKELRHIRKKYACPCCEQYLVTAKKPALPIEKSIASPGLLAYISVNKYVDALPLYRQVNIFNRIGVDLDRSTLANWMIKLGDLVEPLINLLLDKAREQSVLHMDETPLQVLNEPDKSAQSQSYMWLLTTTESSVPVMIYHYSASRSGDTPKNLLDDFSGALMVDGYEGYAAVCRQNNITRLGCLAHARRKFVEAQKAQVKNKTGKADMAVSFIQKIYAVERSCVDASAQERHRLRQEKAKPLFDKLEQWLQKSLANTPPKTALGRALGYLNNQWPRLIGYLDDGARPIDNNRAENAVRPFVIGRKNWLFANSQAGARASANLYSLIETAKANDLEPYTYLKQVFTQLPQAESVDAIEALLPWNVKM